MTQMNPSVRRNQNPGPREQPWDAKEEVGLGGRLGGEVRVRRCQLLTHRMDKQQVLLCSTGDSGQYPGINHNGKG